MTLRWRIFVYGALLFATLSAILLSHFRSQPIRFLALELMLIVLGVMGYKLISDLFRPLELLADSTKRLNEQEFTTRLAPLGHQETDQLIEVYNKMIESLRQQRIFNQEQAHFLQKIVQSTQSAIVVFDFDHHIEQMNPAAETFLELSLNEAMGKKLTALETPLAALLTDLPIDQAVILPFKGQRRLKCTYSSFLDRGFQKYYLFMDELTAQLRQTEKAAYEKLIRVMTHEINNSLGAANSLLHSCLTYAPQINESDREDYTTALEVVISRTDHLKTFVGDYVSVIKLPAPKRSNVNLENLLEHVQFLLTAELKRRNISWVWERHSIPQMSLDALQMEQVLLNIIKNAIEAIEQDGTIRIVLKEENQKPILVVQDTGKGISRETEGHLFTPFYTTKADGVGIGLTLVTEVLNNHGFDFSLESPPGKPTSFTIWF